MRTASYFKYLTARWAVVALSVSALLLLAAGTTRVPSLRHYLVIFSALLLAAMLIIDPGLVEERSRTPAMLATPGRFAASLSFLATLALAALDVGRLHRFDSVPVDCRLGGLLLFAITTALQIWAMAVNPFFSPDICLQAERGHRVITSGPYGLLRHPGYLAMLVSVPASALAIGSWIALLPAAVFCVVIMKRVSAEDEFLEKHLAGYAEYMRQVRARLVPRRAIRHCPHELAVATRFEHRPDQRWP